nr:EOG090X0C0Q [Eulimnadia texana]
MEKQITENVVIPALEKCVYTSCYCEENVWHLCDFVRRNNPADLSNCWVVFISNKNQTIPLWEQKASRDETGLVIWDYHVIFVVQKNAGKSLVYDLDSRLNFPCDFDEYVAKTIQSDDNIFPQFHRFFRVVPADVFLRHFASDRRHMRNPDGTWMKMPPVYPPISANNVQHNLNEFLDMNEGASSFGEVLATIGFVQKFS